MRIGISVLTDAAGNNFVYGGKGEVVLPLVNIEEHKELVKKAASKGLTIGKKSFVAGMVLSQYGVDCRKKFPVVAAKK